MIPAVLPTYARADLAFERGEGAWLVTAEGRRYLDFAGGIAVCALGHCHPHLVEAVTEQAKKLWHTSNIFKIPGGERLAQRLVETTFADTVFFTNSGAEANECAIKMARIYHYATGNPQRYRIITFEGAFHGRTLATIAAAGSEKMLKGFGPPVEGFDHVPFDDIEALKAAIGPETAAVMFEPIQGEGGIKVISPEHLREIRKICDDNGLLLIYDEVQCGMGRSGKLFAYEWAGEEAAPDIMPIAKAIGGGFPLGACLATEKAAVGMVVGTHGSTYGGNPLAMAAGNAVLDVLLEPGFIDHVNDLSNKLVQSLSMLVDHHPDIIEGVRGRGLILGLKVKPESRTVVAALRDRGLLTAAGADNVVRLLPPLNITEEEIRRAVEIIDITCAALAGDAAKKAAQP